MFYLCGPDLWSCFGIVTTWFLGPHGAEWPSRCHMSEEFSFQRLHWARLFFLFNWLGREKVSWDVNKDNESLPKVEPSRRRWDVLIKWLSSEGDRVTVQEGESLGTIRSTWRGRPLLKLANLTQRQPRLRVIPPCIQVRETDVAVAHPPFYVAVILWHLCFCDSSESNLLEMNLASIESSSLSHPWEQLSLW